MSKFELQIAESTLRKTYNTIWCRKNTISSRFYDVYSKRPIAKIHFRELAEKLIRLKIEPKDYMTVVCSYGKWEDTKFLPPPGWIVKDSTIEIYEKWLKKNRLEMYGGDRRTMVNNLSGDNAIKEEEILTILKSDKESLIEAADSWGHKNWNHLPSHFLFMAFRNNAASEWYLALKKYFMESSYLIDLGKDDVKKIRQCKYFYNSNPDVKKKAKLLLRGEEA